MTPITPLALRALKIAIFLIASLAINTSVSAKKISQKATTKKTQAAQGPLYATRTDAMQFADELASRNGLNPGWVRQTIGQARYSPSVARLMQPPTQAFAKNWQAYRRRFIDPIRIQAGINFWHANQNALERAEKQYGVPAEIIVGIIGVETIYGRNTGSFRVLDALSTLAFDYPAAHPRVQERSDYFKGELTQFLIQESHKNDDPFERKGSYAGAMGMPQFMPSSWVKYAVDFDGDGVIDLWNSPADAIGSVANYLNAYGWKPGMPAYYPVSLAASHLDMDALMAPDILPTFSVASFTSKGAQLEGAALEHPGPLALVELLNGPDAPQYVAGTENFYVITRYNWSSYYAMAVLELGREVAAEVNP
ncbi:murein transglycosylase [Polaromonas sp.]|nr:murein transglycosylase [Polaromonas sp.]